MNTLNKDLYYQDFFKSEWTSARTLFIQKVWSWWNCLSLTTINTCSLEKKKSCQRIKRVVIHREKQKTVVIIIIFFFKSKEFFHILSRYQNTTRYVCFVHGSRVQTQLWGHIFQKYYGIKGEGDDI